MSERIDDKQSSPRAFNAMLALQQQVDGVELEPLLLELVTTRASQINGCAFCLDMHTRDAMARGESAQRLHLLPAWRETTVYSARECAALAWTEALTLVAPEPRAAGGLRRGAAHVSAVRAGRSVAGDRRHPSTAGIDCRWRFARRCRIVEPHGAPARTVCALARRFQRPSVSSALSLMRSRPQGGSKVRSTCT